MRHVDLRISWSDFALPFDPIIVSFPPCWAGGLGEDVPISTGNLNDGLIAMKDGKMIVLRVPYPMGFYAKGFDGRIDDPKAGWKGRGLWTTSGDRAPWLKEGGKGAKPIVVHFQIRPDPLAR